MLASIRSEANSESVAMDCFLDIDSCDMKWIMGVGTYQCQLLCYGELMLEW
jgi:hypothetical protein